MDTTLSPPRSRRPGAARIAAGATLGVIALLLVAAGIAGIVARASSDGGYISTGAHRYASANGRAIVTDAMHVGTLPTGSLRGFASRRRRTSRSSWASVGESTSTATSRASRARRSKT